MSWSLIVPSSLLSLGAFLLVLAVLLVFLDVPDKGVPWDKVAAVFAVIGGFGVGGASAGFVGSLLTNLVGGAVSGVAQATAYLVGVSVVGAVGAAVGIWAWARVCKSGISAKSKFKSFLVVGALALVGTVLAAIPRLYGAADELVRIAASAIV